MVLPFVRDLLADLEHCDSFERVRRHLSLAAGRRRVSGLTSTARALHIPLFAKAAQAPVVVVVADNKAADALQLAVRAACELTGAIPLDRVVKLPAHDVLPFENLSPHPDVQEQRATALWKMATGAASIVIAPVEATALRMFPASYYLDLARVLRRGEEVDVDELLGHLASVGYSAMDIVEMPGQFTRRGGILDIYSPEMDRPVRVDLFGDEIESEVRPRVAAVFFAAGRGDAAAVDGDSGDRAAAGGGSCAAEREFARGRGGRKRRAGGLVGRRDGLSGVGVLLDHRRRRRHDLRSVPALPGLRRRAGDGEKSARALVEQGRAPARPQRHRVADDSGRRLPQSRAAAGHDGRAAGAGHRSAGRC
jgi:hypothetical protein